MGAVAAALASAGSRSPVRTKHLSADIDFSRKERHCAQEGFRAENIPAGADVVVVGNAIKRGNPEAEAVLNRKLFYLSLPEVLKNYFLRGKHNLVVTGTHGKTTTTALARMDHGEGRT